jgi:hypothetical protein
MGFLSPNELLPALRIISELLVVSGFEKIRVKRNQARSCIHFKQEEVSSRNFGVQQYLYIYTIKDTHDLAIRQKRVRIVKQYIPIELGPE